MIPEIDQAISDLATAFQRNPFDFFRENDVTCFLHSHMTRSFPTRVPVTLLPGIERFGALPSNLFCSRVHTEVKLEERGTQSFDLALLHERPCHIYAKSQGAVGGFKPPFLSVIEVKLAYGSRSVRFSIQGTPSDIQKLWAMRSAFDHAYVVVVDFFEKRSLATIRDAIRGCNGITVAYIGLDHSEVLKPEK